MWAYPHHKLHHSERQHLIDLEAYEETDATHAEVQVSITVIKERKVNHPFVIVLGQQIHRKLLGWFTGGLTQRSKTLG